MFLSLFTNSFEVISDKKGPNNKIVNLIDALAILPSRLDNTNARDFTSNVQTFTDSIALINNRDLKTNYEKEIYKDAQRIERMVDALESAWKKRISDGTYYGGSGYTSYYCSVLRPSVARFNRAAGRELVRYNGYSTKAWLGGTTEECSPQEYQMVSAIKKEIKKLQNQPKSQFKLKTPW